MAIGRSGWPASIAGRRSPIDTGATTNCYYILLLTNKIAIMTKEPTKREREIERKNNEILIYAQTHIREVVSSYCGDESNDSWIEYDGNDRRMGHSK